MHTPDEIPAESTEPTPVSSLATRIAAALGAEECLALAAEAEGLGQGELQQQALEKAIALDRNCHGAMLTLAAAAMDQGASTTVLALLEETARGGKLPVEVEPLRQELFGQLAEDPLLADYFRTVGRITDGGAEKKLSIVVLTNLFPPQEFGGYGRMMWEFARGLVARGHRVQVLTSDVAEFRKIPTPDEVEMESRVSRRLRLLGRWESGKVVALTDPSELRERARDNASRLQVAVTKMKADLVLVGNIDLLGASILRPALDREVPVLHALANAKPGYRLDAEPREEHYWVAPCSDWNGRVFRQEGYAPARVETLYPGARVDRFFRLFLPDATQLRICYASIVKPYKGADTLVSALVRLQQAGVSFTAEIAGEAPDPEFLAELKAELQAAGLENRVSFTGFLDRSALSALFARSNVLVFPSRFEEPFGISQVEALAAGLVVVSSGTGGAREIIRDGVDGLLFPAGDANELCARLQLLATDGELMGRLQRRGQQRSRSFSVESAVLKIETLAAELHAGIEARRAEAGSLALAGGA